MKYNYQTGISDKKTRRPKKWLVIFPILALVVGIYIVVNTLTPALPVSLEDSTAVTKKLKEAKPVIKENRLYIPQIGVDVAIVTGVTEETLEGGAWHRATQNGNPANGGNFVLAAHRFKLGLLPDQTRAMSPFYHLDSLKSGDQLYADYDGIRYAYEVTKRYKVPDNDVVIEAKTDEAKMTLYSCDLRGPKAGREVVEAKPIGTIAWTTGSPKLKPLQDL